MASLIVYGSAKRKRADGIRIPQKGSEKRDRLPFDEPAAFGAVALPVDFTAIIEARRTDFLSEDEAQAAATSLRENAAMLKRRWQWRRSQDLENEAAAITARASARATDQDTFDKRIGPCILRYKKAAAGSTGAEDAERAARMLLTRRQDAVPLYRATIGDMCDDCGVRMRIIANDSLLGCPKCAKSREVAAALAPFAESEYIASSNTQKSRLLEWLEFCQAKEYAEPPRAVIDRVIRALINEQRTGLETCRVIIREERARSPFRSATDAIERLSAKIPRIAALLRAIDGTTVRFAMQACSAAKTAGGGTTLIRKNYEHAPKIAARISGLWPPRFSLTQEDTIRKMFTLAAPLYERNRKAAQPHWPGGYAYFLRCLCTLLGWDEFVDHFPVVKAARTAVDRDAQRKIIWDQLGWEFIPSQVRV